MNRHFPQAQRWSIGLWSIYFALKLLLVWQGKLEFDPLYNFALLLWVGFPIEQRWLAVLRQCIAIVCAALLLHHDSFLPPLERLTSQWHLVMQFDWRYLLSVISDIISLHFLLLLIVFIVGYLYLNQIFRISTFVVLAMVFTTIESSTRLEASPPPQGNTASPPAINDASSPSPISNRDIDTSDAGLNRYLDDFFAQQRQLRSTLDQVQSAKPNFDVLFINICSLSWDDLSVTEQLNHPLFKQFDILFTNFNSATSYSGPAVLRILRANCGQQSHRDLFNNALTEQCSLFDQLARLGFQKQVMMNHDGKFDGFNMHIANNIGPFSPAVSIDALAPSQYAFDGTKIYRDSEVLGKWLEQWQDEAEHTVNLYNSISIHDGNRVIGKDGSRLQTYQRQQKVLLDDLLNFFSLVKQSQRNVVVILLPEHGAAVKGDKMQLSGMREIPTKAITNVPVGVKFFGDVSFTERSPVIVEKPTSYLAISDLLANVLQTGIYRGKIISLFQLVDNLPQTPIISQNSGSTMINVDGQQYYRFDGKTWTQYTP